VLALQHQASQLQQHVLQQQQQGGASSGQCVTSLGHVMQAPSMQPSPQYAGLQSTFTTGSPMTRVTVGSSPPAFCALTSAAPLLCQLPARDSLQQAPGKGAAQRRYSMLQLPSPPMWSLEVERACPEGAAKPSRLRSSSMLVLEDLGSLQEHLVQYDPAGLRMAADGVYMGSSSPSNSSCSSQVNSCMFKPGSMFQTMQSPLHQQTQLPRSAVAPRQAPCSRRNSICQYSARASSSLDVVMEGQPGVLNSTYRSQQLQQVCPRLGTEAFSTPGARNCCAPLEMLRSKSDVAAAAGTAKGRNSCDQGVGGSPQRTSLEGPKMGGAASPTMVSSLT
jgi:hypothetical protein